MAQLDFQLRNLIEKRSEISFQSSAQRNGQTIDASIKSDALIALAETIENHAQMACVNAIQSKGKIV